MITVCITSCGRYELLKQTLDSFCTLNEYPIERWILHEDSANLELKDQIRKEYPFIKVVGGDRNVGLLKSIDNLYALVTTPYVFHLEDDWLFSGNKHFIQESLDILEHRNDIHQVWIRKDIPQDWLESYSHGFYRMVRSNHHGDWCGYSFNPGLRRIGDHRFMFPKGLEVHNTHQKNSALSEHACNLVAAKYGYRAALLNNPACQHIGEGKSTYK